MHPAHIKANALIERVNPGYRAAYLNLITGKQYSDDIEKLREASRQIAEEQKGLLRTDERFKKLYSLQLMMGSKIGELTRKQSDQMKQATKLEHDMTLLLDEKLREDPAFLQEAMPLKGQF